MTTTQLDLFEAASDAAGQCSQHYGGSGWRSTTDGRVEPVPRTRCPNPATHTATWTKPDGRTGTVVMCLPCANHQATGWYAPIRMFPGCGADTVAMAPLQAAWLP